MSENTDEIKNAQAVLAKNAELLAELKAEREKREALEKQNKEAVEKELTEKQKWEELAKLREKERDEEKAKREANEKALENAAKMGAVSAELEKLGIIPERKTTALRLVNLDAIKYDASSKVVLNAVDIAKELHSSMPEIFGPDKTDKLPANNTNPLPSSGAMTIEWFNSLSPEEKKKNYKEFMKANGHNVK